MDFHSVSLIITLVILFSGALIGGFVAHKLRFPLVLGYIGAGLLLGTIFPKILDTPFLSMTTDIGIVLLLFTLGLEFSFKRLRRVFHTIFWAAIVQIVAMIFIFYSLLLLSGIGTIPSLFIAVAAALSSTTIVIKVLSERGELDTVPGEALTGWLVIQDLSVLPIMILVPSIVKLYQSGTSSIAGNIGSISLSIFFSILAIIFILIVSRSIVPKILSLVVRAGSREVFVIATIGIVFVFSAIFYALGLSAGLGAFVAGIIIADTSQNHAIFSEVRPLRDLFATIFFVSLGMMVSFSEILSVWTTIVGWTALIIVVKFILTYVLGRSVGYHPKAAFIIAVGLAQLSEFGFLIAKEGSKLGALTSKDYTTIVAITFLSLCINMPILSKVHDVYYRIHRIFLRFFPKFFKTKKEEQFQAPSIALSNHVVLCGYGRVGKYVGRALEMAGIPFIVVEYNIGVVKKLREKNIPVLFGDPADLDVLDFAEVDKARAVVIAIPDRHTQELIIGNVLTLNKHCHILCRTHHEEDQLSLKTLGATTVIQPEFEAAVSIANKLLSDFGIGSENIAGKVSRLKIEHGLG